MDWKGLNSSTMSVAQLSTPSSLLIIEIPPLWSWPSALLTSLHIFLGWYAASWQICSKYKTLETFQLFLNFLSQVFETLPVTLVLSSHKLVSIIVSSPSDLIYLSAALEHPVSCHSMFCICTLGLAPQSTTVVKSLGYSNKAPELKSSQTALWNCLENKQKIIPAQ